jgi:hypothetical protein
LSSGIIAARITGLFRGLLWMEARKRGFELQLSFIGLHEATVHDAVSPAVPIGSRNLFKIALQALDAVQIAAKDIPLIERTEIFQGFNGVEKLHGWILFFFDADQEEQPVLAGRLMSQTVATKRCIVAQRGQHRMTVTGRFRQHARLRA